MLRLREAGVFTNNAASLMSVSTQWCNCPTHSLKSDVTDAGPMILYNTLEVSIVPFLGRRADVGSIYDIRNRGLNSQIYVVTSEFP